MSGFLLRFDKRLRISQQISARTARDTTSRQDGLSEAPAASVLSTAPRSWVGSVCVKISRESLQKRSKQQRSKFTFGLGELERQTDGYYNTSRLPI